MMRLLEFQIPVIPVRVQKGHETYIHVEVSGSSSLENVLKMRWPEMWFHAFLIPSTDMRHTPYSVVFTFGALFLVLLLTARYSSISYCVFLSALVVLKTSPEQTIPSYWWIYSDCPPSLLYIHMVAQLIERPPQVRKVAGLPPVHNK